MTIKTVTNGKVEVLSEPLTYEPGAPTSYFRDLALAENGDTASRARLSAHKREMAVELERREARGRMRAASSGVEYRVNPNRTPGQGGYFAPPLWLIEDFATVPRPGRVLASLIPSFPLPAGVGQVSLPAETTGTVAGPDSDGGTQGRRQRRPEPRFVVQVLQQQARQPWVAPLPRLVLAA